MSKRKKRERLELRFSIPPQYYWYYSPYFYRYEKNYTGTDISNYSSSWGIRWIYALLLLIVIVLQFGKNPNLYQNTDYMCNECQGCECYQREDSSLYNNTSGSYQLIDNSVLFIIVVFLLAFCGGCWQGYSNN